jgi:hypothetical protein
VVKVLPKGPLWGKTLGCRSVRFVNSSVAELWHLSLGKRIVEWLPKESLAGTLVVLLPGTGGV